MVPSLVLAAGESKRMGRPKALLTYGEQTFVEIILEKLQRLGVAKRNVVLGPHWRMRTPSFASRDRWRPGGDGRSTPFSAGCDSGDDRCFLRGGESQCGCLDAVVGAATQ